MNTPNEQELLTEDVSLQQMEKYKAKGKFMQKLSLLGSVILLIMVVIELQFPIVLEWVGTIQWFLIGATFIGLGMESYYFRKSRKYQNLWLANLTRE